MGAKMVVVMGELQVKIVFSLRQKLVKSPISLLIYKKSACKSLICDSFYKMAGSGWLPD